MASSFFPSWNVECLSSGSAALSPDGSTMLVNNLNAGTFDIYCLPSNAIHRAFSLDPMGLKKPTFVEDSAMVKQCAFAEAREVAICRSDRNLVQTVNIATGKILQPLVTNQGEASLVSHPPSTHYLL